MATTVKRLFISQKMNGLTIDQIKEDRAKYLKQIQEKHPGEVFDVIPTLHEDFAPNLPRLHYLGASIQQLSDADLVVFTPGYDTANGCYIEFEVCRRYNIPYEIL